MIAAPMALAAVATPLEGQHPQPPVAAGGYGYQLHLPSGYSPTGTRWPLMIFLHGSGERGSDIARVKVHGPPKIADRDPTFPFVLVSPLLAAEGDWDAAKLSALLAASLKSLRVDPTRVYLTGLSRGGHATWRWASAEPWRFAAIAPVAGRGDPSTARPQELANMGLSRRPRRRRPSRGKLCHGPRDPRLRGPAAPHHLPGPRPQQLGPGL